MGKKVLLRISFSVLGQTFLNINKIKSRVLLELLCHFSGFLHQALKIFFLLVITYIENKDKKKLRIYFNIRIEFGMDYLYELKMLSNLYINIFL